MIIDRREILSLIREQIADRRDLIQTCEEAMRAGGKPVDFECLRVDLSKLVKAAIWLEDNCGDLRESSEVKGDGNANTNN